LILTGRGVAQKEKKGSRGKSKTEKWSLLLKGTLHKVDADAFVEGGKTLPGGKKEKKKGHFSIWGSCRAGRDLPSYPRKCGVFKKTARQEKNPASLRGAGGAPSSSRKRKRRLAGLTIEGVPRVPPRRETLQKKRSLSACARAG